MAGAGTAPLRVGVVHSYYSSRQPSGENSLVEQQVAAFQRAGIETLLVEERTDERENSPLHVAAAAFTVATGRGRSPLGALTEFAPDVVHVHNLFPNFGRTWVKRWKGPLVAHAHNYRPLCPVGTFFRDGQVCTNCLDGRSALPSLLHGCYRDSRLHTLPLTVSTRFGADPVLTRADRLLVLSQEMAQLYTRGGVPASRVDVVHNFIPSTDVPEVGGGGDYWLYAGRLTAEKGILELIREWPRGRRLVVAGAGPQLTDVRSAAGPGVEVVGQQSKSALRSLMAGALGLVFPSRWLEGLALVALESLAVGTPVLAWRPAPAARLVAELGVGAVAGPDLAASLDHAATFFPSLRPHCRSVFEERFTESAWVQRVCSSYNRAGAVSSVARHDS
ncbi:glycosyltransferase family 4 protein [Phycicoccus ginsengisoli]